MASSFFDTHDDCPVFVGEIRRQWENSDIRDVRQQKGPMISCVFPEEARLDPTVEARDLKLLALLK